MTRFRRSHMLLGILAVSYDDCHCSCLRVAILCEVSVFLLFFALTIFAAYEKNARILDPTSPIAQHFAPAKWYLPVHAFFGVIAMAVAAFQFSNRLRARYIRLHRVLGYVYVTSVSISAPFAVVVAMKIPKSFSLVAANCMQSFGWVVSTAIAFYCVRSGNIALHRRWMIRSYPFAMVFTVARTVRVVVPGTWLGPTGGEAVLWIASALAAFLPSIFLDSAYDLPAYFGESGSCCASDQRLPCLTVEIRRLHSLTPRTTPPFPSRPAVNCFVTMEDGLFSPTSYPPPV